MAKADRPCFLMIVISPTALIVSMNAMSSAIGNAMANALLPLPKKARRSFTFDQGVEFTRWRGFSFLLGTESWFCSSRAPWQKGAIENPNGRVRRYLPRTTDLAGLGDAPLPSVVERLNTTPRKCLGYKTPNQAFRDELRMLRYSQP